MDVISIPVIDPERCNGCGLCVGVCSCNSLVLEGNLAVYINKECTGCTRWCHQCEMVCPAGAISCPFEVVVE